MKFKKRTIVIALGVCTLLLFNGAICKATKKYDEAKEQFSQGLDLFEKGNFQQASVAFETAYQLKPSYKLLYNIGQVENQLGHHAAALKAYENYIEEGKNKLSSSRLKEVNGEIKRLKSLVGYIVLKGKTENAIVFVDKRRQDSASLNKPLSVDLGDHEVIIRKGKLELYNEIVRIRGGQQFEIDLAVNDISTQKIQSDKQVEQDESPTFVPSGEKEDSGKKRAWTWVAFGIGGAGVIGLGVAGPIAISRTSKIKNDCDGTLCTSDEQNKIDDANTAATVATIMGSVAVAGIVVGIILAIAEPRRKERPVKVSPNISSNGASLMLTGRF